MGESESGETVGSLGSEPPVDVPNDVSDYVLLVRYLLPNKVIINNDGSRSVSDSLRCFIRSRTVQIFPLSNNLVMFQLL